MPPNENYPRELMQLFTLGIPRLNPNGTPMLDAAGAPIPAYTEEDVKELARIFTGWTFGDGNSDDDSAQARAARTTACRWKRSRRTTTPARRSSSAQSFPAGQTASEDLDQALDVLFNHPNVGPFVSRQLIQQLVTSNPSPALRRRRRGGLRRQRRRRARRSRGGGARDPDASRGGRDDAHLGQAVRAGAVRRLAAARARRARSPTIRS